MEINNRLFSAYTTAVTGSKANPTTTSAKEKEKIDVFELFEIVLEAITYAKDGNNPSSIYSLEEKLGLDWNALDIGKLQNADFYELMTRCYSFVRQIESMDKLLTNAGITFNPLAPVDSNEIINVALNAMFSYYYDVKSYIEKFEALFPNKTDLTTFLLEAEKSIGFTGAQSGTLVELSRSLNPYKPKDVTYTTFNNETYNKLNLGKNFGVLNYIIKAADSISSVKGFTAKPVILTDELIASFLQINAGSGIGAEKFGIGRLISSYYANLRSPTLSDSDVVLWKNILPEFSTNTLLDQARILHSYFNGLIASKANTVKKASEVPAGYEFTPVTKTGTSTPAIKRQDTSLVAQNLSILLLCIKAGNTMSDLQTRYNKIFKDNLVIPTGGEIKISPTNDVFLRITDLVAAEKKAAEEAIAKGDMFTAYGHYQNAASYMDETQWGSGPYTEQLKAALEVTKKEILDSIADIAKVIDSMHKGLTSPENSLLEKLNILGKNKNYITLYEKWFEQDMAVVGQALIDGITEKEELYALLDSGLYGVLRGLKQSTSIRQDGSKKITTNTIENATTACIKRLITPLVAGYAFDDLNAIKRSVNKVGGQFSSANYADIVTSIDFALFYSPVSPKIAAAQEPVQVKKTVEAPTTETRPSASSALTLDLTGNLSDLSDYGLTTVNPGDSTAFGSDIWNAISSTTQGTQIANSNGDTVAILFDGKLYLVDPDTQTVIGEVDPDLYTLVDGVLTFTGEVGDPPANALTLTSGSNSAEAVILGDLPLDLIVPVGSTTTSVAADGTTVLTLTGVTEAKLGDQTLTITPEGTITLTPEMIESMIYEGLAVTITGPNGEATLTVEQIFGTDNVAWGDPEKLEIEMQSNGAYNIVMNEFAPSCTYRVSGMSDATTTINYGGNTLTFPPRVETTGSSQAVTLADGSQIIFGHGLITITSTIPGEDGTVTESQSITLPDYPPILKSIGDILPPAATMSFYRYKYDVLPKDIDAYEYIRDIMNMDGLRLTFSVEQHVEGKTPVKKETSAYLLLNDPAVVKAYTFLTAIKEDHNFTEDQYLKLYVLSRLSKKYADLAFDAKLPAELTAQVVKDVRLLFGVTVTINEGETLHSIANQILAVATQKDGVMLFADENANKKTHVFTLGGGIDYIPIDDANGSINPFVQVSYDYTTEAIAANLQTKLDVPLVLSENPRTSDESTAPLNPEIQGYVKFNISKDLAFEVASKYSYMQSINDELPGATYFGSTVGLSWNTPFGFARSSDTVSWTFFGQVATGWQATFLDTLGMQIMSVPLLARLGLNYDRFFKVELGLDALHMITDGLPSTAVYKDLDAENRLIKALPFLSPYDFISAAYAKVSTENLIGVVTGRIQETADTFRWSIPADATITFADDFSTATVQETLGFKSINTNNFMFNTSIFSNQHFGVLAKGDFSFDLGLRINLGTPIGNFNFGTTFKGVGTTNLIQPELTFTVPLGSID